MSGWHPDKGRLTQAANSFLNAGLSVICVRQKEKAPLGPWKQNQTRQATPQEIAAGLNGGADAIALVCGGVSGNLEMLDFDLKGELFAAWTELVRRDAPGLYERLVIERSQSGGFHALYRCPAQAIPGNMKLAMRCFDAPDENEIEVDGKRHKPRRYGDKFFAITALIETRGEGGYFLCAPSPGYEIIQGRISELPAISLEEREAMIAAARSLNEWVAPVDIQGAGRSLPTGEAGKPGDDFNQRGDLRPLLQRHGWTPCGSRDGIEHWRRPGKSMGRSASLLGGKIFYVFSTNAPPFEPERAYSPFAVLASLEHGGDFSAAAKSLSREGFGHSDSGFKVDAPQMAVQAPEPPCAPVLFEEQTPPQIPPEIVPGILRDFSLALAEAVQVPFELALANALGAVAVAAQRKLRVQVKDGYSEGLNLYALCPLPPGERKSATVEACKRPLVEWQRQARLEAVDSIRDAESERKTLEKAIEQKRQNAAKAASPEARRVIIEEIQTMERELPEVPVSPRLLADDFTPEALGVLMEKHEERIGLLEAEGGLFDTLAGKYSSGVPNLDAVLKFWSGEPCQIDRRGRAPVFLSDPHLTLCISPQPEIVQGLADKPSFRGRGLVGRFLFFMPQSRLGCRSVETAPVPSGVAEAWKAVLYRILALPWALDEQGEPTAYRVRLEPEAYALWRQFAELVEVELRPGGEFEHMTDWAGKFPGQAVRLAGLLHVSTVLEPHREAITADTMRAALDVAAILAEHAKAAFALMGTDSAQECAKAVLRWIMRDRVERFTARDALEKVKGRFPTMERVNPGLLLLEERAFVFQVEAGRAGPGRKPSQAYTVNPKIWEACHGVR